jgi:hypothetical protein
MKIKAILLALAVAGFAASFAVASDGDEKKAGTTTGATTGEKGDKAKCKNVSLKGTAAQTSFTVAVDKSSKAGRDLASATLAFSGKVSINARMCAAATAGGTPTFTLRELKVSGDKKGENKKDEDH